VRYRRQAYELTVPIADGPITRATLDALATSFHAKHEQTYGHANRAEPVQLVNLRLTALGRLPGLTLTQRSDAAAARQHVREVWFAETGFVTTPVHWRDGLLPDTHIAGPAIIEAMDSTTVIPPAWRAAIDDRGYIRLSRERVESVTSPTLAALSPEVGEGRDDGFVTRRPRSLVPQAPSPQPAPTTGRGE
jgi:N-methylhydantoinase A